MFINADVWYPRPFFDGCQNLALCSERFRVTWLTVLTPRFFPPQNGHQVGFLSCNFVDR
jgi:hypothetical protein